MRDWLCLPRARQDNALTSVNQLRDKPTPKGSLGAGYRHALSLTVESISQYSVETDAEALQLLRENLALTVSRIKAAAAEPLETVTAFASDIRGILRVYRDRSDVFMQRMRLDVKAVRSPGQPFVDDAGRNVQERTDAGGRDRPSAEPALVVRPRGVAERSPANRAQPGRVCRTVAAEKDSIIAQLKSEIQTLHRSLDEAQRAAKLDPVTGMSRKDELVRVLRRKVVAGESFGVIHVSLQNLHELACEGTAAAVEEILVAFSRRMHNVVPGNAEAGEWDRHTFCILCPEDAIGVASARVERSCSGRYVYMQEGISHSFNLRAVVSCLGRQATEDADSLLERLEQRIAARG